MIRAAGPPSQASPASCTRWTRIAIAAGLQHIEDIITFEGPQTIAAVIVESVVGTNGLIIPPDGYMQGLRELCTRHGILLICDEIMSGFGRTGEWFAVDHWGVVPDIMTVAKGLTSAYVPLGAAIVTDEIAQRFEDHPLYAGLTYNSHPVGCAAALACINVYKEDGLIENARRLGGVLATELDGLKERHPSVGDVRSIGLFSLVELVKDRATRAPLTPFNPKPTELGPMPAFSAYLREHGFFTFVRWNSFFINPPLHRGAAARGPGDRRRRARDHRPRRRVGKQAESVRMRPPPQPRAARRCADGGSPGYPG